MWGLPAKCKKLSSFPVTTELTKFVACVSLISLDGDARIQSSDLSESAGDKAAEWDNFVLGRRRSNAL